MVKNRRSPLNKRKVLIFILAAIGIYLFWPASTSLHRIPPSSASTSKAKNKKIQSSGLSDGDKFIQDSRIKGTTHPDGSYSPSVLFISFHEGTAVDFHGVATKLNFTYEWTYPRSQYLYLTISDPYIVSEEHADFIWSNNAADTCKNYDVIVIADTVPAGGRTYIQGLLAVLRDAREGRNTEDTANEEQQQSRKNKNKKKNNSSTKDSSSSIEQNGGASSPRVLLKELGYKAKVVLLLTQRFDYNTFNDTAYYTAFKDAVNEGVVEVIANNPFEEYYMKPRAGIEFEKPQEVSSLSHLEDGFLGDSVSSSSSSWLWHWMTSSSSSFRTTTPSVLTDYTPTIPIVRPHGRGWDVWPSQDLAVRDAILLKNDKSTTKDSKYNVPALINTRNRQDPLLKLLNDSKIDYTLLQSQKYGGPHGLSLYKCFIHSPYQVSTMSLYENLAAGVVIFVPTVDLLKKIGANIEEYYLPEGFLIENMPWELVEWYNPYFEDVIIKFSSAKHLKKLLESTDFEKASRRAVEFMNENEKKVLQQWREIIFT